MDGNSYATCNPSRCPPLVLEKIPLLFPPGHHREDPSQFDLLVNNLMKFVTQPRKSWPAPVSHCSGVKELWDCNNAKGSRRCFPSRKEYENPSSTFEIDDHSLHEEVIFPIFVWPSIQSIRSKSISSKQQAFPCLLNFWSMWEGNYNLDLCSKMLALLGMPMFPSSLIFL